MDPFSGAAFAHLTSDSRFRCTVVGPRCLLACLRANTPVPEMPYPLYTAAMRGLNVSFTGLQPAVKKELRLLVERMSGVYSNNFHDGVTHLVAGSVVSGVLLVVLLVLLLLVLLLLLVVLVGLLILFVVPVITCLQGSDKYNVAVGKEIPVMTAGWVRWATIPPHNGCFPHLVGPTLPSPLLTRPTREVWASSCTTTAVTAQEARFASYRCPALLGVIVCVSGMGERT